MLGIGLFTKFKYKDSIYFKGGTSLSKVYNLIERFSEDIDLVLDWRILNYYQDEPYINRTNRQQELFNKEMNNKTAIFIKEQCLKIMNDDFMKIFKGDYELYIDDYDPQTICFRYPQNYTDVSILQVIRLEIGALAEPIPSANGNLQSYIGQCYPNIFDSIDVNVVVVSSLRTFFEKLLIIHREAIVQMVIIQ